MAEAGLKVGQAFVSVEVDMSGVARKMQKQLSDATKNLKDIRPNVTLPTGLGSRLSSQLTSVKAKADDFIKGGVEAFGNLGKRAAQAMGVALGAGAGLAATAGLKNFAFLENAQIGFETMLGSGEKAKKFLDDIQNFAVATPFDSNELVASSQKLLAMGFSAESIIPTLTRVGNASAALGKGSEGVDRITTAIGQMKAKTKVQTEEMLQLIELGIPAWDILAKKAGKTSAEMQDLASKGQISADWGVPALLEGLSRFDGLMDKQSQTLQGRWDTLIESSQRAAGKAIEPLAPALTGILTGVGDRVEGVTKWLESDWPALIERFRTDAGGAATDIGSGLANALLSFSIPDGGGILGQVWEVLSGFVTGFGGRLIEGFANIDWASVGSKVKDGLTSAFSAIGDGATGVFDFAKSFDPSQLLAQMSQTKQELVDGVLGIADQLKNTLANIDWANVISGIGDLAGLGVQLVAGWFSDTAAIVTRVTSWVTEGLNSIDWGGVGTGLGNLGTTLESTVAGLGENVLNGLTQISQNLDLGAIKNLIVSIISTLKKVLNQSGELVGSIDYAGIFSSIGEYLEQAVNTLLPQLQASVKGLLDDAFNLISDPAFWATLGQNIGAGVASIGEGLKNLLGSLVNIITSIDLGEILAKTVALLVSVVHGIGTALINALPGVIVGIDQLLVGIVEGLARIGIWLVEQAGIYIGTFGAAMVDLFSREFSALADGFLDLFAPVNNAISSMLDGISEFVSKHAGGMWDAIKQTFKDAINAIIRWWNDMSFSLPPIVVGGVTLADGYTFQTPDIPMLAKGGHITRPTMAVIGEAGPEIVAPQGAIRAEVDAALREVFIGKAGGGDIIVNQHFAGAYIEPKHAQRAAKLGLMAAQ